VLRNTGRLNIPNVYLTEKKDFVFHSVFCGDKIYQPRIADNEHNLMDEIEAIAKKYANDEIFCIACSDEFILPLSQYRNQLPKNIILNQPSYDTILSCVDKYKFYCILEELKIPTPKIFEFEAYQSGERGQDDLSFPCFVKPKYSHLFQKQFGKKGFTCYSSEDILNIRKILGSYIKDVFIQEIILGNSRNHFYCDGYISKDRSKNFLFARQRCNMFPPEWGNSTSLISIKSDILFPVINHLDLLMDKLEYSGIYSLEVKYDESDGKFKFIELNPRSWWYNIFPSMCGLNLYQIAIDDLKNQIKNSYSYKEGIHFVYMWPEVKALLGKIKSGKTGLLTALKEFSPALQGPIFALDDLKPILFRFGEFVQSKLNFK